jgi:hypothetical protein
MYSLLLALLTLAPRPAHAAPPTERGGFVTTLGRDTVALETFTRTPSRLEGDIVVRVPGTVLCHYELDLAGGRVTRSVLDVKPMGTSAVAARHTTLEFGRDSVRVDITAAGRHEETREPLPANAFPLYRTGFGPSYGLYTSLGIVELYLPHVLAAARDTVTVTVVDPATGGTRTQDFVRLADTLVDAQYFHIGWRRLTLDSAGQIVRASARETTEQTRSRRTPFFDIGRAARHFADEDRAGKGIGIASPSEIARATIGGQLVVATYNSPRLRGRTILGTVVPYGQVWRTGANQATQLLFDHALTIGGTRVPGGTYTLWTLPQRDGSVTLIINRQHGQWGTNYDPELDLARIPMQVTQVAAPREDFAITITGGGQSGTLRIAWDRFVWTVPVVVP